MDCYVTARRMNRANRQITLCDFLTKTHLFAGFDQEFITRIAEEYGEKMSIWWNANSVHNCQLPANEMVTFVLQGKFFGIIAKEFDGEPNTESLGNSKNKDTTDKKLILETLNKGKHFGDALSPVGVYDDYDDQNFTISYYAQSYDEKLVCLQIEESSFQDMINENPMLSVRLLNIYKERLKFTTEKVRRLSQMSSYQRLRNHLYEVADETDDGYQIDFAHLTQQMIADTLGCNRTTVTKELKILEKNEQLIKLRKKLFQFSSLPTENYKN